MRDRQFKILKCVNAEARIKFIRVVQILRSSIRAKAENGSKIYRVAPFLCVLKQYDSR
ncbi:hypothetical protein CAMGR0001_1495 [Campylobacter gracilis RM3268]|uniref:Uncharacterized protein n=1 Tax=Campylobacter gracilis RM3268 TaxID=553220 RepID=C8PJU4_9BACT|nr:hypothetical protein CAMGR0001_1495 [Campylobacter gracilis RM3268]